MRTYKTEGIIIKRKNYGEADRILTVLTPTTGKIQVKASGIRRIPSRRSAHVELLNFSQLSLYKGSGFPILTEAQTIENFSSIKDDLNKVGLAFHLCELIDGLCPENQENTKAFYLLKNILTNLSDSLFEKPVTPVIARRNDEAISQRMGLPRSPDLIGIARNDKIGTTFIREFEIELLTTLGYLPAGRQGWNKADMLTGNFNTHLFIENILERKLRSRDIFSKLQ